MAPKIHQVSSERIRDEISRILTEGQAARGMRMLEESGLRAEILPELELTGHLERCLQFLAAGAKSDFAVGVFLHETLLPHVRQIVERLKFSRAELHHIIALVENLPAFKRIREMSVSALKRFFRLARFEDHLELARIHAVAAGEDLSDYEYAYRKRREWNEDDVAPAPLISGEDLIALGFNPGPKFREILTSVEDEQLEGRLRNRDQAIEFVQRGYGGNK